MKKYTLVILVVLALTLTGCTNPADYYMMNAENTEIEMIEAVESEEEKDYTIDHVYSNFSEGYMWISSNDEYLLIDEDGKIIFQKEGIKPVSCVHHGYFIVKLDDDYYLYNTAGKVIKTSSDDEEMVEMEMKYSNDLSEYVILYKYETNSIDGTESEIKYYRLTTMKEIIDSGSLFDIGGYTNDYRLDLVFKNYSLVVDVRYNISKYHIYENNGFFTITDTDGNYLFDPIEGDAIDLDGKEKIRILAKIDDYYYFVDKDGKKEKITISFNINTLTYVYGDLLIHKDGSGYRIVTIDGEEITVHD